MESDSSKGAPVAERNGLHVKQDGVQTTVDSSAQKEAQGICQEVQTLDCGSVEERDILRREDVQAATAQTNKLLEACLGQSL